MSVTPSTLQPDPDRIRAMFNAIAKRYDIANTTLSGGIHHLWRRKLVAWSRAASGDAVLDCATGTGDLAIAFKKTVGDRGNVAGIDFSPDMLKLAKKKAEQKKLHIAFEAGDVINLSYKNAAFDITSIAFGIRNVADPLKALHEMARVTKPGGYVMILEFGQPRLPGWKQLYTLYSKHLLPYLGGLVTGRREAYSYLQTSSAHFPCRDAFTTLMQATGKFMSAEYLSLTGGVAYIYRGKVL